MSSVLPVNPGKTANDYFNKGNQFKQAEQFKKAIFAYEKAIELNPNFCWYHHNLAEVLGELERWEEAVASYQKACDINPNSEWSFYQLGEVFVRQEKPEEAIAVFERAIEINPQIGEFYCSLGQVLFEVEQLDEAVECLQKALELEPESAVVYQYLWEVLARQNRGEEGLVYLQKAVKLNPGNWELHQKLGEVWQGKRKFADAEKCYRKVVQLHSGYHWAYYKLGVVLREQGRLQEAIACLRKTVELEPGSAICHHYLGHSLSLLQEWEEAIECYRKAIELAPESAIIYQHLGYALAALGKWNQAVVEYRKGVELDSNSLENPHHLGYALHQLKQWDEAISYYLKALELDPNSEEIQSNLANALLKKDLFDLEAENDWLAQLSEEIDAYTLWRRANEPREADLRQKQKTIEILSYKPLMSVILPVYNTPEKFLREAIESVLVQIYPHWELCIADDASTKPDVKQVLEEYAAKDGRIKILYRKENGHISASSNSALELATGEFIALLDHDDLLTPDALYEVALLLNRYPEADMIYSDEDKIDEQEQLKHPFFKPEWCPDSFLSRMYTCHLGVYRRSLVNEIQGFRVGYEGSQDYDLVLRLTEKTSKIFHIPKILYHWRIHSGSVTAGFEVKPYAYVAAKKALTEAIHRRGETGKVIDLPDFIGAYTIRYSISEYKLVSIIIPTRDLWETLDQCLESIFTKSTYPNYEVIVVDNGSQEKETYQIIYKWKSKEPSRFKCYIFDVPFNYSKINNYGVTKAKGDYLLFLNNDTEVITPDWIEAMVEQAQRKSIGAVGALLLYPDDTIQHAGIIMGLGGLAAHGHCGFPATTTGYAGQVKSISNFSALTGACLMCRREVFEQVQRFDEELLAVAYNDVDLCLKMVDQGYRNIYLPHVTLYHYESKSRGYENTPEKKDRQQKEANIIKSRWQRFIDSDPCYSPHLTREKADYSLNIVSQQVKVNAIHLLEIDSDAIFGWCLDKPQPLQEVAATSMNIEGWILGKKQKVVFVEIVYGSRVIEKMSVDKHRVDIASAYPEVVYAGRSGFSTAIAVTKMPPKAKLTLRAIFKDESRIQLAIIQLGEQVLV
ncbi:tetratricopeptide repeat protein [Limnoraphis robusta]|uniref:Tetratricopeptide repeat protein n=1 Tax=Limnoraphis robusta CCNP1315 TaxID=3110306 RepID=A0ABU5U297_9CYAN|nr:tetratricopeptide repeat protein [Limnoraphis robusta]MEA5521279.1 tetratricopeptide repeat protein [Limnoraphis robusta CCNP1315]MEA5544877.1 tetratricopeptide repeat protein [Limnoraphis robusta CCNP1324]